MSTRSIRRTAALAGSVLAISAGFVGLGGSPASADDPVIVFYTQCDEMNATATVKVKRINEDKTGATVIGDTGIADCGAFTDPIPEYYHSGFAAVGEYGYVAWQKSSGADAGIARIRLDGSSAVERTFVDLPDSIVRFQMSPKPVDGHLYFYADSGQIDPNNPMAYGRAAPRIMKVNVSTKAVSTVYTPDSGDPNNPVLTMSFGVGKDALYFSTDATSGKDLERVTFNGQRTGVVLSLGTADNTTVFLNGQGANLVSESSDTLFLYTQDDFAQTGTGRLGFSTAGATNPSASFSKFAALPGVEYNANNGWPSFPVWGENFLYYKNVTGKQISRTTKDGDVQDNYFATIVKDGWIHHISPAKASTVTVTTTTTTSSTTSTTAAANTTSSTPTSSAAPTTVSPTTTQPAPTVPKKGGLAGAAIARFLSMTVPKGAKVGLKVAPASKKVCTVKSGKLLGLKPGNCKVTATVTPKKGKSTKKSTTLKV